MTTVPAQTVRMTPTSRQISENVVVLLLRIGMSNKDLGDAIGMNRVSIGNRILGKTEWKAYEVDAVARALLVSPDELMGRIPDFKEWDRRRSTPALRPAAAGGTGPRFLVMPEADLSTPPSRLGPESHKVTLRQLVRVLRRLLVLVLGSAVRHLDDTALPHAPAVCEAYAARSHHVATPVRVHRLATRHRSRVPLRCGLSAHAERRADGLPRRATVSRGRDVQDRCAL